MTALIMASLDGQRDFGPLPTLADCADVYEAQAEAAEARRRAALAAAEGRAALARQADALRPFGASVAAPEPAYDRWRHVAATAEAEVALLRGLADVCRRFA